MLACAVCFGKANAQMAWGMNAGILFMLGVVVVVLSAGLIAILNLAKRSKKYPV